MGAPQVSFLMQISVVEKYVPRVCCVIPGSAGAAGDHAADTGHVFFHHRDLHQKRHLRCAHREARRTIRHTGN